MTLAMPCFQSHCGTALCVFALFVAVFFSFEEFHFHDIIVANKHINWPEKFNLIG